MKRAQRNPYFTLSEAIGTFVVAVLFIAALIVSYQYGDQVENLVFLGGPGGMGIYILLAVASVVVAPAAALPFLPIAVTLWGSFSAALFSLAGWSLGAVIAFALAKKYGRPFVAKVVPLDRAESLANRLTGKHAFWLVLLSRVVMPTDIVSYAIGLFVPIRFFPYACATLLGTTPLAFALAYGVALTPKLQGTVLTIIIGVLAVSALAVFISTKYLRAKSKKVKATR